jgi:pimeloyl-ACP methyl ester carboxylesterase
VLGLVAGWFFQAPEPLWRLTDGLLIAGIARGGRLPVPNDAVLRELVNGRLATPAENGTVTGVDGQAHKWVRVKAEKDGFIKGPGLGNGYVYATYDSPTAQDVVFTATSDTLVYVNGEAHAGDPYGYGYLSIPVRLKGGKNEFLFLCNRGQVAARVEPIKGPRQFGGSDLTLPDIRPDDKGNLLGAVPVLNNLGTTFPKARLRATIGGQAAETWLDPIPAKFVRKEAFVLPLPRDRSEGNKDLTLELVDDGGRVIDRMVTTLRCVNPLQPYKRTFTSQIDGSVQYYAVTPCTHPDASNALVLTLHGASVEALGQAQAYASKDWCTIVAATNRRPYGFDWEKWGRRDGLEVLGLAEKEFPHDPSRVSVTGHSMGGHGTWAIGSLYPDLFASVNPSAGWISFASYGGGYRPANPTSNDEVFRAANLGSDTLARKMNLLEPKVYVLHGDADDNVPVSEARTMRRELEAIGAKIGYHEEPGAGHWWGSKCVDYPDLFENIRSARILPSDDPTAVKFATPNPAISAHDRYVTIVQSAQPGMASVDFRVDGNRMIGTTANVAGLELGPIKAPLRALVLDGQEILWDGAKKLSLRRAGMTWASTKGFGASEKRPERGGPFEAAFTNRMALVYGTGRGDGARNLAAARYLAEAWLYRGNGALDVVADTEAGKLAGSRNLVLIGNEGDNSAWKRALAGCPIHVSAERLTAGHLAFPLAGHLGLFLYPLARSASCLVGAVAIGDDAGLQALVRLPIFASGSDFPDWTVIDATKVGEGTAAVVGAGFFDNRWQLAK